MRNARAGCQRDLALVDFELSQNGRKEGSLAAAVSAHQAHSVACLDLQAYIFEQQSAPAAQGDSTQIQHGRSGQGSK